MIKFFRKIRQNLLMENKTGKYFKYAIGEIVLVVVGILIALQINNWNEKIKTQENVQAQLINLIDAIESDVKSYENLLAREGFRFHAVKYLLGLVEEEILIYSYDYHKFPKNQWSYMWDKPIPDEYDEEYIRTCLSILDNGPAGSIINKSAISEFNSTGLFSSLKNVELKKKINEYYIYTDTRYVGRSWEYKLDISLQIRDWLLDQHQIDSRRVRDVKGIIELFKNDTVITSKLHILLDNISWSCQTFLNSSQIALQVLEDIKAELNQLNN
jgi:hypothetical protein